MNASIKGSPENGMSPKQLDANKQLRNKDAAV